MFSVAVCNDRTDKGVLASYRINSQGFFKLPCFVVYQGTTLSGFYKNSLFMSSISGHLFHSSLLQSQDQKVGCVKKALKNCVVPTPLPWTGTPARPGCSRPHPAWPFGEGLLSSAVLMAEAVWIMSRSVLATAAGGLTLVRCRQCSWEWLAELFWDPVRMLPLPGLLAVLDECQPAHSLGWLSSNTGRVAEQLYLSLTWWSCVFGVVLRLAHTPTPAIAGNVLWQNKKYKTPSPFEVICGVALTIWSEVY